MRYSAARSLQEFLFGQIDLRPLGLMRFTFGLAALGCTAGIAPVLEPLFSDSGVAPLSALHSGLTRANRISVFDAAGSDVWLWIFYVATLLALLSFAIGYRTRLATIASFVLLSGLYERNPLAMRGASELFRVMLFWLIFTPCGAVFSLDARRIAGGGEVPSAAGRAFPVRICQWQVGWMYLSGGLFKLASPAWRDGSAVSLILGLQHSYATALGHWLGQFPHVTNALDRCVMAFELAFLPLTTWPLGLLSGLRGAALAVGTVFHLGLLCTTSVAALSLAALSTYPMFFEPRWLRVAPPTTTKLPVRLRPLDGILLVGLIAACWNGGPPQFPALRWSPVTRGVESVELWQRWNMWSPNPLNADVYIEGRGKLSDGERVDVLHGLNGGPVPEPGANYYWTTYFMSIAFEGNEGWTREFGRYLCRTWNFGATVHERYGLDTFELFRVERPIARSTGEATTTLRRTLIWTHHCKG